MEPTPEEDYLATYTLPDDAEAVVVSQYGHFLTSTEANQYGQLNYSAEQEGIGPNVLCP